MAEFPALPLFTDAYLADTRHLSTLQHGAYCLMLMTAWRSPDCSLPSDDIQLARIAGLDRRTWLNNKPTLIAFWKLNAEHRWVQQRLLDERGYVERQRNKNSLAGIASALKRKNRGSTTVQPIVHNNPSPTPTLIPLDSDTNVSSSPSGPKIAKLALTEIPPDWEEWAKATKGWDNEIVMIVWSVFRDHWQTGKGRNTKRKDWKATWQAWCLKENIKPKGDSNANYRTGNRGNGSNEAQAGAAKTSGGGDDAPRSKWDVEAERIARKWQAEWDAQSGRQADVAENPSDCQQAAEAVRTNGGGA